MEGAANLDLIIVTDNKTTMQEMLKLFPSPLTITESVNLKMKLCSAFDLSHVPTLSEPVKINPDLLHSPPIGQPYLRIYLPIISYPMAGDFDKFFKNNVIPLFKLDDKSHIITIAYLEDPSEMFWPSNEERNEFNDNTSKIYRNVFHSEFKIPPMIFLPKSKNNNMRNESYKALFYFVGMIYKKFSEYHNLKIYDNNNNNNT